MGKEYPSFDYKDFDKAYASVAWCGWTDADLKAIAVLSSNTKKGGHAADFNSYEKMVPALRYTHQIDIIEGDKITFNNKAPRQIDKFDVMSAHYYGRFTHTQGTYEAWKAYCSDWNTSLPDPFDIAEFDFKRSWLYMRAGQIREIPPQEQSMIIKPKDQVALPLDNSRQRAN
ncbi:MAG: hypothetical protein LQ339_001863 [Xanthoria mediterranea]|nr:MAG: hypothetical protein LQ339_001863 [Xanthoria mediterranea]